MDTEKFENAEVGDELSVETGGRTLKLKIYDEEKEFVEGEDAGVEWTTNPCARVYQGDVAFWVNGATQDAGDLAEQLSDFTGMGGWGKILQDPKVSFRIMSRNYPNLHETAMSVDIDEYTSDLLLVKTSPFRDHDIGNEQ